MENFKRISKLVAVDPELCDDTKSPAIALSESGEFYYTLILYKRERDEFCQSEMQ